MRSDVVVVFEELCHALLLLLSLLLDDPGLGCLESRRQVVHESALLGYIECESDGHVCGEFNCY